MSNKITFYDLAFMVCVTLAVIGVVWIITSLSGYSPEYALAFMGILGAFVIYPLRREA